jgi:hypothetical protein
MYVIIKELENSNFTYFSMLASNGVFEDNNLAKAIIFPTAELATKQKEVLAALNPNDTFKVKQIVLQDIQ